MFVEITRGRSVKGLAQYCLHDVGGKTAQRVSFVETRNLATDDPQVAWRIMAARHYLQDDLKAKAGVGKGGRKDGKPVGHLLLSWKREEADAEGLTRAGMMNAAIGALKAIGAGDHQALIVAHRDTPHPHCHVIINLIGDDGRIKKQWKEHEKLSRYALKREMEIHGEPVVKSRRKNWLDREAGETPTPVKKKPRHLYEVEKAANQNDAAKAFAEKHRRELAALQREKTAQTERQRRHRDRLLWCKQERARRIVRQTGERVRASRSRIRKEHRATWDGLLDRHDAERREFDVNERNMKGSLANAMALIDWKKFLRRKRAPDELSLSHAFHILTSEATRRQTLHDRQGSELQRLRTTQRGEEQSEEARLKHEEKELLRENRQAFVRKTAAMKEKQSRRRAALEGRQKELTKERNGALRSFREREHNLKQDQVARVNIATERELGTPERIRRPRRERRLREERLSRTHSLDNQPPHDIERQVAKTFDDLDEGSRGQTARRRERER